VKLDFSGRKYNLEQQYDHIPVFVKCLILRVQLLQIIKNVKFRKKHGY